MRPDPVIPRVVATRCAALFIASLERSFGPIVLLLRWVGEPVGEVGWRPSAAFKVPRRYRLWGRLGVSSVYVIRWDIELIQDQQIVIEAAFGEDRTQQVYTEIRLVSFYRPSSDGAATIDYQHDAQHVACATLNLLNRLRSGR